MQAIKTFLAAAVALGAAQAHALSVSVTPFDGSAESAHTQVAGATENTFDGANDMADYSHTSSRVAADYAWAAQPAGSSGRYLSIDTNGHETITFAGGASYFGMLWGSPDGYNLLTVTTNKGSTSYTGDLIDPNAYGDRAVSGYANFTAGAGESIRSVTLFSYHTAFESDNHAFVAAPVPEPETWALMFGGLAAVGFMARRRRSL